MAYEQKLWSDRKCEHPMRRTLTPTGAENEYDVARAEGVIAEDGDPFNAETMNDLEQRVAAGFKKFDPDGLGAANVTVQLYSCVKTGSVYALTGTGTIGRCKIPATWVSGDSFTVNGNAVPAYCGADPVDGDSIVAGRWALFVFDGAQLNFNGGGGLTSGKLAQATADENSVIEPFTFYAGGSKRLRTGKIRDHGSWPTADKLALDGSVLRMYKADGRIKGGIGAAASLLGDAAASDIPKGKTASSAAGLKMPGTMPVPGTWNATVPWGGSVTVPPGRHSGTGKVTATSPTRRDGWGATINPGGSVTVPEGYHNGQNGVQATRNGCLVYGILYYSQNGDYKTLFNSGTYGSVVANTFKISRAGKYRAYFSFGYDPIGQASNGVKRNGAWIVGPFINRTGSVEFSAAAGDVIYFCLQGYEGYGHTQGAMVLMALD